MRFSLPRRLGMGSGMTVTVAALFAVVANLYSAEPAATQTTGPTILQQSAATALGLARAARSLPEIDREKTTQAALSIILLAKFNRLLPPLPSGSLNQLEGIFLANNPDPAEQESVASKLPPADTLIFDGSRLAGGNFRNIDALIGNGGRPIALDREVPAWIIPLEPGRAQALDSTRGAGMPQQNFAELQRLYDRIHNADVGDLLVADGIFLRPYAGPLDDLHHHLVQKGGRNGQLDFFALLDSLPARQYSPVSGTAGRNSVPPLRARLGNVLSGGSFQAIENFRAQNPAVNAPNPFKGFAARALPYIRDLLQNTAPGSELRLSGDTMRRAITNPNRYSPDKAPPLFRDPSRFLGQWEDPRFIRVSKKKKPDSADLFAEIQKVDFETPLPEMSLEPAGNELLAKAPVKTREDDTKDLMQDLGLPPQAAGGATYEPPDKPEPVLPPTRLVEQEPTPVQPPPLTKPAPPLLDFEPLETPPVFDLAQAATPTPTPEITPTPAPVIVQEATPQPTPEPLPSTTPAPQPPKPSAIAVIPPPATPTPSASPATPEAKPAEPQIAKAIPVRPSRQPVEGSTDSSASPYRVAVLTPTANEAVDYLKKIAASDRALSDNLAASRRADYVIRWLGDAVKPFEPLLTQSPTSPEAQAVEPLIVQARDEVVALLAERETLKAARLKELADRQAARQNLEKEIQTTRRDELARRTGTGA